VSILFLIVAAYCLPQTAVLLIIIGYALYGSFGAVTISPWGSWMADLLPESGRGRFYARRNQILTVIATATFMFGGLFLDKVEHFGLNGYVILFILALICRIFGYKTVSHQYEPKYKQEHTNNSYTFWEFLSGKIEPTFTKYIFALSLLYFANNLSAPFFSVIMLNEFKYSMVDYTSVRMGSTLASLIMLPFWGRWIDRLGSFKAIKMISIGLPFFYIFWIFFDKLFILMLVGVYTGTLLSGLEVSFWNSIYDFFGKDKRIRSMSYTGCILGLAVFAGNILGGKIVNILPAVNGSHIRCLFLLSSFILFIPMIIFNIMRINVKRFEKK